LDGRGADEGETFFVGEVVLAEVVWVLVSRCRCDRDEIASVVRQLTEVEELELESTDRVVRALRSFQEGKGGFADYLIAERAKDAGCASVATFDKALHTDSGFAAR
jgi:predicted nucleic-acid-binding protein